MNKFIYIGIFLIIVFIVKSIIEEYQDKEFQKDLKQVRARNLRK